MTETAWHLAPCLRPLPAPGLYFARASLGRWSKLPKASRLYGGSFYAIEDTHQAGAMCHVIAEMDGERRLHLVECWHKRTTLHAAVVMLRRLHEGHCRVLEVRAPLAARRPPPGPLAFFHDKLQLERAAAVAIANVQRQEHDAWNKGGRITAHRPVDPPVRPLEVPFEMMPAARRLQGLLASGGLLLPARAPWLGDLLAELALWPAVPTEAQVGALAILAAGHAAMSAPQKRSKVGAERAGVSGWAV